MFDPYSKDSQANRRRSARFPIDRDVRVRLKSRQGEIVESSGKTINVSSNGILITTDQLLLPGTNVEIAMDWPVGLSENCGLRLVGKGVVVRVEGGHVGIQLAKCEFRTKPRDDGNRPVKA